MKRGRIIRWSMRREFMLFWVILHSCARNSTNGTILRTKTGDDIVRMSVMMIDDNIFRPNRHLEDENCTREMRARSKDFFWWRERATFKEANRRIGWMWVRLKRLIWLHIFLGTSRCNPPRNRRQTEGTRDSEELVVAENTHDPPRLLLSLRLQLLTTITFRRSRV